MKKYAVTGMSCAACQARVEKAVLGVEGVESCAVSLLTNSMGVEGTADDKAIIEAVEKAGYGASSFSDASGADKASGAANASRSSGRGSTAAIEEALKDRESPILIKRLISSLVVLLILMYFSMGHMMWGWPVIIPAFHNHVALALFEMLLALIVMGINNKFFSSGFRSLFHGSPNMDTLVALGSTASFGYSLAVLFIMIDAMGRGDSDVVMKQSMNLYFESAAMIPTLITVGKLLEAKSKGRTTDALKSLMRLAPKEAKVERDGEAISLPIEEVRVGDIYVMVPGDIVPVDGVIVEGNAAINEAALTGESIPVERSEGEMVQAGTINTNGHLRCQATRVGEDTTLSQIIQMVSDAAATKAPLARIADKVSAVFVPAVIGLALVTFICWTIMGRDVGFSIARAISVLVISCPCALGLATPVAIMVGNGMGAKHGILYKTSEALEGAGRVGVVVLDKTGTITKGEPGVTDVISYPQDVATADEKTVDDKPGTIENRLMSTAYSLEQLSEHPLARAIVNYVNEGITDSNSSIKDFETLPGAGVKGVRASDGATLEGGSYRYIAERLRSYKAPKEVLEEISTLAGKLSEEGKTPLLFLENGKYLGMIAVADQIKDDSTEAIGELRGMGIKTIMLTGDNFVTAEVIAKKAGVDDVIAGVMPDEKEQVITKLQNIMLTDKAHLRVAMVGDGINDAVALTRADSGFAIGAGTDVAIDAADVVLMKNSIRDVAAAIRMSRATIRNIHENLFWAFFYNALCIPLAMGVYGIAMKPMYGAAAMALSSFFVCMNALRLNLVKLYDSSHDKAPKQLRSEELSDNIERLVLETRLKKLSENINSGGNDKMEKTILVEGMMCSHCEATVKKALEALDGVSSAVVSHEKGTAVVELTADVSDDVLTKAVEDKDYKVTGIN